MHSTDSFANDRILIVDDNVEIHRDFRAILETKHELTEIRSLETILFNRTPGPFESGFEIDSAYQGKEGYAKVQAAVSSGRPYALAFVDMRMPPSWDGLKTAENLWRADPDLEIVICTAYSDYSWSQIVEQLGANAQGLLILKKPFDNIEVQQLALALTKKWQFKKQAQAKQEELQKSIQEATVHLIQTEKLSALGELTASVAHELNQPLNAIKIICEDVLRDIANDRLCQDHLVESLKEAIEEIEKIAEIVDHMRVFSRRPTYLPRKVILSAAPIRRALKLIGQQLKDSKIEVLDEIDEDLLLHADGARLEQALLNILVNARDAVISNRNKKAMQISIRNYLEEKGPKNEAYLVYEIGDNGNGIPESLKEKIFEPFFTRKEPGKGTGLGLSAAMQIVKEHGGKIEVESTEGAGSIFRVFLPRGSRQQVT